jgi:hypothetical protein
MADDGNSGAANRMASAQATGENGFMADPRDGGWQSCWQ